MTAKLKTIDVKGKAYITVNERLKYFREAYPDHSLETVIVQVDDATALLQALIKNAEGRVLATGTAYERANTPGSMVNRTSHVENAETSAWGRALGNFGIGIDTSVASAEEVKTAQANQGAASPEQLALIGSLVKDLGKDEAKMWEFYGVRDGKPSAMQAATIITQLSAAKRNLAKEPDSLSTPQQ